MVQTFYDSVLDFTTKNLTAAESQGAYMLLEQAQTVRDNQGRMNGKYWTVGAYFAADKLSRNSCNWRMAFGDHEWIHLQLSLLKRAVRTARSR